MGAFSILDFFRLSDEGVRCGEDGLFIGAVPLLLRSPRLGRGDSWTARAADELDRDLGDLYGLPIDVAAKRDGLIGVAQALERGDLALAKIAALLLRFPDPPSLAKGARGAPELAARLFDSNLLKGDWDPSKHPRQGEGPNRGWFAPTERKPEPPKRGELEPTGSARNFLRMMRDALKETARAIIRTGHLSIWAELAVKDAVEVAADEAITSLKTESVLLELPKLIMEGQQRAVEQARASLDPPKTLVELQTPPTENVSGYELHHIVEQNPSNLKKSPVEVRIEKFGRPLIDSPSNLVWVPRLKHELITGYYNSLEAGIPGGRLHREVVSAEDDFNVQRKAGLEALRRFGVLK